MGNRTRASSRNILVKVGLSASLVLAMLACSSDSVTQQGNGGQGGNATGGAVSTGGGSGGSAGASGSGGATGSGGRAATGGARATGGSGSGGAPGSGGRVGADGGLGGRAETDGGSDVAGRSGPDGSAASGGAAGGTGGAPDTGGGTGTPGTGGAAGGTGTGSACASTLPAVTDYSAAGPFATTTESKTGPDGQCTIYRPKTLGENGFLHAPIIFGPGIGMQATQLSGLLTSFASHGYVVVGTGVLNGGPNDPANKAAMQNALNWIIQQSDKAGTYQGKIATKCAISMGYSVGGTSAVEIGSDPAVATVVSIHGHKATAALHGTMLQTSGTKDSVGLPMQQYTFDNSKVQTFMGTVADADHGYIQSNNGGVQRPAIIAWMRYWINGDTNAKKYFDGDSCVMCTSPWTNPQRKNWK